jgi:hypothetical protein
VSRPAALAGALIEPRGAQTVEDISRVVSSMTREQQLAILSDMKRFVEMKPEAARVLLVEVRTRLSSDVAIANRRARAPSPRAEPAAGADAPADRSAAQPRAAGGHCRHHATRRAQAAE